MYDGRILPKRYIWRIRNPGKQEFSWFKRGDLYKASRIDLALVSGGLDQNVEMVQYLSSIKTDHRALYLVVDLQVSERGSGFTGNLTVAIYIILSLLK